MLALPGAVALPSLPAEQGGIKERNHCIFIHAARRHQREESLHFHPHSYLQQCKQQVCACTRSNLPQYPLCTWPPVPWLSCLLATLWLCMYYVQVIQREQCVVKVMGWHKLAEAPTFFPLQALQHPINFSSRLVLVLRLNSPDLNFYPLDLVIPLSVTLYRSTFPLSDRFLCLHEHKAAKISPRWEWQHFCLKSHLGRLALLAEGHLDCFPAALPSISLFFMQHGPHTWASLSTVVFCTLHRQIATRASVWCTSSCATLPWEVLLRRLFKITLMACLGQILLSYRYSLYFPSGNVPLF